MAAASAELHGRCQLCGVPVAVRYGADDAGQMIVLEVEPHTCQHRETGGPVVDVSHWTDDELEEAAVEWTRRCVLAGTDPPDKT